MVRVTLLSKAANTGDIEVLETVLDFTRNFLKDPDQVRDRATQQEFPVSLGIKRARETF